MKSLDELTRPNQTYRQSYFICNNIEKQDRQKSLVELAENKMFRFQF